MQSKALDDFIDNCILSGDDICKFEFYRSKKYDLKVNPNASKFIASIISINRDQYLKY